MVQGGPAFALTLLGSFRLDGPGDERVDIRSKRGQALIALLAMAARGERTRSWLQEMLWGNRSPEQAGSSLRRELSNLRKLVNRSGVELLQSDNQRVWLDLDLVGIDTLGPERDTGGELLEGLDLPGCEGFEEWLRLERARIEMRTEGGDVHAAELRPVVAQSEGFSSEAALAVLRFAVTPADERLEIVADGLAEDLIERLARLRWLPIIARSSSFAMTSGAVDPRDAGAQLGARYVVEGRVRGGGAKQELHVTLSETERGQVLWSSRLDLVGDGQDAAQDEMLGAIAATLELKIDWQEQARAGARTRDDLSVTELVWRARWHFNRLNPGDLERANELCEEALALEPNSPEALVQTAWLKIWELWLQRGSQKQIRAARRAAQNAIVADHEDARGHMLAGIAEIWLRQPLRAEGLLRRATALNPSLVMAHAQLGSALYLKGDNAEALGSLQTAMRLSPNDQNLFYMLGELAMIHLFEGRLDKAIACAEDSLSRRAGYWVPHVAKTVALIELGNAGEARRAFAELKLAQPDFEPNFVEWLPFVDGTRGDFLKDRLNQATE